ncbi:hypothetical protein ACTFIW_009455 [Dictyostelium discoideum]
MIIESSIGNIECFSIEYKSLKTIVIPFSYEAQLEATFLGIKLNENKLKKTPIVFEQELTTHYNLLSIGWFQINNELGTDSNELGTDIKEYISNGKLGDMYLIENIPKSKSQVGQYCIKCKYPNYDFFSGNKDGFMLKSSILFNIFNGD